VPDRFIVIFNSVVVLDTGYIGLASSYSYGSFDRNGFNGSLLGKIDPITLLTYPNAGASDVAPDGYPNVYSNSLNSPYDNSATWNKTTSNTNATVNVYGSIPGTAWSYTMYCPGVRKATICTGLTQSNACLCNNKIQVYYSAATITAGTYIYSDSELTTF
jgi:hypothetical protein